MFVPCICGYGYMYTDTHAFSFLFFPRDLIRFHNSRMFLSAFPGSLQAGLSPPVSEIIPRSWFRTGFSGGVQQTLE